MSDILIKGMGIPKDCKYVDVRIFRDGTATTSSAEEPFYKKMDVVEVPKHGRLIDADALERKAKRTATEAWKMKLTAKVETTMNQFIDWVKDAPTIIEREEGT